MEIMMSFENTGIRLLDIEELEYVSDGESTSMEEEVVVTAERPPFSEQAEVGDRGARGGD
jgi:hypothetical protein